MRPTDRYRTGLRLRVGLIDFTLFEAEENSMLELKQIIGGKSIGSAS